MDTFFSICGFVLKLALIVFLLYCGLWAFVIFGLGAMVMNANK